MLVSTIALFVALALPIQEKSEIAVKHVSAQYMYDMIMQVGRFEPSDPGDFRAGTGLLPEGIDIAVTDRKNSLTAVGSAAAIRETERIVALFDVLPSTVDIDVIASVPALGRNMRFESTVFNNTTLDYYDQTSETRISVVPRVNGDGTITLLITAGTLGYYVRATARIESGQVIYGQIFPRQSTDEETGESRNTLAFRYTTIALDPAKFFSLDDPLSLAGDWFFQHIEPKLESDTQPRRDPPIEAELRFIISARNK